MALGRVNIHGVLAQTISRSLVEPLDCSACIELITDECGRPRVGNESNNAVVRPGARFGNGGIRPVLGMDRFIVPVETCLQGGVLEDERVLVAVMANQRSSDDWTKGILLVNFELNPWNLRPVWDRDGWGDDFGTDFDVVSCAVIMIVMMMRRLRDQDWTLLSGLARAYPKMCDWLIQRLLDPLNDQQTLVRG